MILDGVSYSVFIQLCRVILSSMVEPYCGQFFLEQVLSDTPSTFVSGRLSTPLCFPFNATMLIQYVLHHRLQDS